MEKNWRSRWGKEGTGKKWKDGKRGGRNGGGAKRGGLGWEGVAAGTAGAGGERGMGEEGRWTSFR